MKTLDLKITGKGTSFTRADFMLEEETRIIGFVMFTTSLIIGITFIRIRSSVTLC